MQSTQKPCCQSALLFVLILRDSASDKTRASAQTATLEPFSIPHEFFTNLSKPFGTCYTPWPPTVFMWATVKRKKGSITATDSEQQWEMNPEVRREGSPKLAPRGAVSLCKYSVSLVIPFHLLFNILITVYKSGVYLRSLITAILYQGLSTFRNLRPTSDSFWTFSRTTFPQKWLKKTHNMTKNGQK